MLTEPSTMRIHGAQPRKKRTQFHDKLSKNSFRVGLMREYKTYWCQTDGVAMRDSLKESVYEKVVLVSLL